MHEWTALDPQARPLMCCLGMQSPARRQAAPGLRLQCLAVHHQATAEQEKLQTPGVFDNHVASRLPIFEAHFLMSVVEQNCCGRRASLRRNLLSFARLAHGLGSVIRAKLPETNEDRASVLRGGYMRSPWRVADIRASRIVAMFVLKNAVEDDEFLATGVGMARKGATWRITHDRGGASLFLADAEQHAPVDTWGRAGDPVFPGRMHDDGTGEIIVDTHGQSSAGSPSIIVWPIALSATKGVSKYSTTGSLL